MTQRGQRENMAGPCTTTSPVLCTGRTAVETCIVVSTVQYSCTTSTLVLPTYTVYALYSTVLQYSSTMASLFSHFRSGNV